MSHILDRRLKEVYEYAERERALKEVASATEKEKVKAAKVAKKKVVVFEKARVLAE